MLRSRLTSAGLGSPAPGVWISTHAERLGEVEQVLADAGLRGGAGLPRHARGGQLPVLVRQAWDLQAVGQLYEDFVVMFSASGARDPLADAIGLVHAWRRFPWPDPARRPLLPPGWSGTRAAAVFSSQHARWSAAAVAEWRRISSLA